jgi:hypothetical protein
MPIKKMVGAPEVESGRSYEQEIFLLH